MSTTARQTWVRRAGRYFTDTVPGHTHRVAPATNGTGFWTVHRQAHGTDGWQLVGTYADLKNAKAAALADDPKPVPHHLTAEGFFEAQDRANAARARLGWD